LKPEFLLQWGGPAFDYPLNDVQLEMYINNANSNTSETLIYKVIDDDRINVLSTLCLQIGICVIQQILFLQSVS